MYPFDVIYDDNGTLRAYSGSFPLQDFLLLAYLTNQSSGKLAVEIGSWTGQSACVIANYLKEGGKLFCIDNFLGTGSEHSKHSDGMKDILTGNLERFGFADVVTILEGNSNDFVDTFEDESIDFMFIDGDHRYSQFTQDFERWYPKIKMGGTFSGHDFNGITYEEENVEQDYVNGIHHGIAKAIKEYCGILEMHYLKGSSMWWVVKTKSELGRSLSRSKKGRDNDKRTEEETRVFESIGVAEFAR